MPVLNFKYVVFSFSFIYLPIGSDYRIKFSLVLNVFREKKLIVSFLVKYKISEMFATD